MSTDGQSRVNDAEALAKVQRLAWLHRICDFEADVIVVTLF